MHRRIELTRILPRRKTMYLNADALEADLRLWKGARNIGFEIVKAKQHSEVLYREYLKHPASVLYKVISEIFESRSDAKTSPGNEQVRKTWAKLSDAIEAAEAASQHIMATYAPSDPKATKCLFHSEHVLYSLVEAERLLEE